jgi:hypothetical protein
MSGDLTIMKGIYSEGGTTELGIDQIHEGASRRVGRFHASREKPRAWVTVPGRPTFPAQPIVFWRSHQISAAS